jgi:hypothetical protein
MKLLEVLIIKYETYHFFKIVCIPKPSCYVTIQTLFLSKNLIINNLILIAFISLNSFIL